MPQMIHVRVPDEQLEQLNEIFAARRTQAAEHGLTISRSAVIRLLIQREHAALSRPRWKP